MSRLKIHTGSLAAALTLLLGVAANAVDANLDVGDWGLDTTSRTLPAVVNTVVDIGNLTFNGGTGNLIVSVNTTGTNWSVAKRYVVPMRYNLSGISPTGTWLKVLPEYDTGSYANNNFDLNMKVDAAPAGTGVMNLRLQVSRTDGINAGTANIAIESTGVSAIAFASGNAVVAVPTAFYKGSALTQTAGRVGVNTSPAADAVLDIYGGNTMGLRLRPRTLALAPTTGTWSKGTMIVDVNGDVYMCTFDGTPGTWKKLTP